MARIRSIKEVIEGMRFGNNQQSHASVTLAELEAWEAERAESLNELLTLITLISGMLSIDPGVRSNSAKSAMNFLKKYEEEK